ncbi:hypothetical protein J6590_012342 [Homalodisca vitripennis]|nr:hypothetical protein J6590_012342 [Homalodisca vitripennis]
MKKFPSGVEALAWFLWFYKCENLGDHAVRDCHSQLPLPQPPSTQHIITCESPSNTVKPRCTVAHLPTPSISCELFSSNPLFRDLMLQLCDTRIPIPPYPQFTDVWSLTTMFSPCNTAEQGAASPKKLRFSRHRKAAETAATNFEPNREVSLLLYTVSYEISTANASIDFCELYPKITTNRLIE